MYVRIFLNCNHITITLYLIICVYGLKIHKIKIYYVHLQIVITYITLLTDSNLV